MIRLIISISSIFCFVIVLGEGLGLGLLWARGQLNADTIQEIRLVLTNDDRDVSPIASESETEQPSSQQVVSERAMRILDLKSRESELDQLKTLIMESRTVVLADQEEFRAEKESFEQELKSLNEQTTSQATELAREVLIQSDTKDAVLNLMALDLDADILLLKGMPEKKIAELLKEFQRGDANQIDRGLKIFEALSQGEPSKQLVDKTLDQLSQDTTPPAS